MPDYRAMYFQLAAQVAAAIELLIAAQQAAEEAYLNAPDEDQPPA